jgi:hypothetical protein
LLPAAAIRADRRRSGRHPACLRLLERRNVDKLRALPLGAKLVLTAGPLLVLSLFFTWQNVRVDYGPAGVAVLPQDGWDAWGLFIGLATVAVVTLVVLRRLTEVELSDDVPWERITLALGLLVGIVTVVKSLTDENSTWWSYAFVALAVVVALGAYLDWNAHRRELAGALVGRERRGVSSTA